MNHREAIQLLTKHQADFHQVVPFIPEKDRLCGLDLSANNIELTDLVLEDIHAFIEYINQQLSDSVARYAVGGYKEHRTVYSRSRVFDPATPGNEPRRLHLGTDIWGKPGTVIMAPLDGIVHSFANNDRKGDYGATIILSHRLGNSSFFTLYGHLSLSSIANLQEGKRISKGEYFAALGIPVENGQWPPHLHFQIILDMNGWTGDYPGVCPFTEKENWLANSPDPDLILQLNQYLPVSGL